MGKDKDGGGIADGGSGISVTVSIVGEGEVDVNGASVCSSDNDPCHVSVTLGGTTSVTAVPATGYQFTSWNCQGMVSTNATLDLQLASGVSCTVTFTKVSESLMVTVTDGKGGTGGVVTSSVGGVSCGTSATTCSAALDYGTMVTLTATPDANYTFAGWSGDCAGTDPSVTLMLAGPTSCVATFSRVQYPLTLSVVGQGTLGAATVDNPTLASCTGASCMVDVDAPSVVTLTAQPGANYRIGSWTGDCVADASTNLTTVTMDMARSCVVTFVLVDRALTVTTSGNGTGTVTRDPDLSSYTDGTAVTLTAAPDVNSDFGGWSGDCSGTDLSTMVTVTGGDRTCDAKFTLKKRTLVVTVVGPGTVVSDPAGIDSGASALGAPYDHGTAVGLTAAPSPHYETAFTGDCAGVGNVAAVTMDADKACTVTFTKVKQTLAVTVVGSGSVTSDLTGIDTKTGATSAPYDWGTTVTLTATPNVGGQQISFVGWTGDCVADGVDPKKATVTLDADRSCTATFTITPYDLAVSVAPTGGGTVTGKIGGTGANVIDCQSDNTGDCAESAIPSDKTVTLVAAAAAGYRFDKWSNCDTDTTATLVVPMNSEKTCVANFVKQWAVTVATLSGPGTVEIDRSSTGAGVDKTCSAGACAQIVDSIETVTVKAVAGNANAIVESFACSAGVKVNNTVTITNPTADVSCSVVFHQKYAVAVAVVGANGTVASAPAGVNACTSTGGTCSALFLGGDSVALTATPATNYQVAWSTTSGQTCDGAVSDGAGQAKVMTFASLDGAKGCTATFTQISVTVNGKAGANGTVAPTTSTTTSGGPAVALTATPSANYHVSGWSGTFTSGAGTAAGCSGSGTGVSVSLSGATPGAVYDCTASFAINQVTLLGAAGANGTVAPTSSTVDVGSTTALTASPAANYHVSGWSGSFTSGSGTATGCSGSGTTANVNIASATDGATYTCTATFAQNAVTVTGSAGTNGTVAPVSTSVTVGSNVTLTASPAAGYHVSGWAGSTTSGSVTATGCSGTAASVTVAVSAGSDGAAYDCKATFALNQVTLLGAAGANGTVAPANSTVDVGSTTALTASPAANYHVSGWSGSFTSGSGTATGCSGSGTTANVNIASATDGATYTCTATFAQNAVTVTGSAGTNGTVAPVSTSVTVGSNVTLTASPAAGYHVSGWTGSTTSGSVTATGCSGTGASVTVAVSAGSDGAAYDCKASFAQNVITVTGSAGANGGVTPASSGVNAGSSVTLTATPAAGYHVSGWVGTTTSGSVSATGCTGTGTSATVNIATSSTDGSVYDCKASFAQNVITVTGSAGANGAVAPASTNVNAGSSVTLNATPVAGFHVSGWVGTTTSGSVTATGCSGTGASVTVNIATSSTNGSVYDCKASFAANVITVTGSAGANGGVGPATTNVNAGSSVTLNATPVAGFHVSGWVGTTTSGSLTATGCSGTGTSVTVNIATSSTDGSVYDCKASFAANVITVTGSAGANGGVGPATTNVNAGSSVTLNATPVAGFHVSGWVGTTTSGSLTATGCSGTGTSVTVNIATSSTDGSVYDCKASFAANVITVTGSAGANGGVAPASTNVNAGSSVTLNATPVAGFHVSGWVGTTMSGSVTATGCSGTGTSVTVNIATSSTDGSVYDCKASFAANVITVTGSAGANGGVGPASSGVNAGSSVTLNATPTPGYHVSGWVGTTTSGSVTATGCSGTGVSVTVNIATSSTDGSVYDCKASFAANLITVTGSAGANGGVGPASTNVNAGSSVTLNATPVAGFHVSGWVGTTTSGSVTATGCSGTGTSVTVNIATSSTDGSVYDCKASFAANVITVTGSAGANGGVGPASSGVNAGSSVTLNATPTPGYHVSGWVGTTTSGSVTATGCSGTGVSVTVNIATSSTDGSVYDCKASFAANVITVTGSAGANGGVGPASTNVNAGSSVTLNATPVAGFHVSGWVGTTTSGSVTATGCSGTGTSVTVNIATSSTDGSVYDCKASFAANVITVTGSAGANGGVGPASTNVNAGSSVTLTATPVAGFHVSGWVGTTTSGSVTATGCSGTSTSVTVNIATSSTDGSVYDCKASFAANVITVTGSAGANGGVAPASTNVNAGSSVTLNATPAANYHVSGWTGTTTSGSVTATGCSGSGTSVTVNIATGSTDGSSYDCKATFAINTVTVNGKAGTGGAVAPSSATVSVGGAGAAFTATPTSGYRVGSWSGAFTSGSGTASGCSGTGSSVTVTMSAATNGAVYDCTASFVQVWNVTVRVAPAPGANYFGTVSSPCTITSAGSTCSTTVDVSSLPTSFIAAPATNGSGKDTSRFVKWICNTGATSSSTTLSTVLTSDITCVAEFYGLWARYYNSASGVDDSGPVASELALAVSPTDGLPLSSSSFLIDGEDNYDAASGAWLGLAGLVAMDDVVTPTKADTDLGTIEKRSLILRIANSGGDNRAAVGSLVQTAFSQSTPAAYSGAFWPYQVTRNAQNRVSALGRGKAVEYAYGIWNPAQPPLTYPTEGLFTSSRLDRSGSEFVLGGINAKSIVYTFSTGSGTFFSQQYVNSGWLVLTGIDGSLVDAARFQVPTSNDGTTCLNPYMTAVNDSLFDPRANGYVVAGGQYSETANCTLGSACPPAGTKTYGYLALLDPTLTNLFVKRIIPSTGRGSFESTINAVLPNLAGTGYTAFGTVAGNMLLVVNTDFAFNITSMNALAVADPDGVNANMAFADVVPTADGTGFAIWTTATFSKQGVEMAVVQVDGNGLGVGAVRFGTAGLNEAAMRILQPSDGGYLLTGWGPQVQGGVNSYLAIRTDENFNVPFNGATPNVVRTVATLSANTALASAPVLFACTNWVDTTLPTVTTKDDVSSEFSALVNVQAP